MCWLLEARHAFIMDSQSSIQPNPALSIPISSPQNLFSHAFNFLANVDDIYPNVAYACQMGVEDVLFAGLSGQSRGPIGQIVPFSPPPPLNRE